MFDNNSHEDRIRALEYGNPYTTPVSFKNALVNSVGFPITQRGNNIPYSTAGWCADRWFYSPGTGVTGNVAPITQTPGSANGFAMNQLNWTRTVVGSNPSVLITTVEHVSTFAGQVVTLSAFAVTGGGLVDFQPSITQDFGTVGSPSGPVTQTGPMWTASTTPTVFTWTVTLPSVSGKTFGTDYTRLMVNFTRPITGNGQTGILAFQAVQLERGTRATEFEVRPIATELVLCERYYKRFDLTVSNAGNQRLAFGSAATGSGGFVFLHFTQEMRTNPTFGSSAVGNFSVYNTRLGTTLACTALGDAGTGPNGSLVQFTVTGTPYTTGDSVHLHRTAGLSAWVDYSCEI